jgi:transposase-like protein
MTRSKLSGPEKQEIAALFEHQQESIANLAERYQVSSSTIRRLLKNLPTPAARAEAASAPTEESIEPAVFENVASAPPKPRPIPKSLKNLEEALVEVNEPQQPRQPDSASAEQLPPSDPKNDLSDDRDLESVAAQSSQTEFPQEQTTPTHRPVRRSQLLKKSERDPNTELTTATSEPNGASSAAAAKPVRAASTPLPEDLLGSDEELSEILQEIGHDTPKFVDSSLDEEADDEDSDDDDDFDEGDDGDDDIDLEGFVEGDGIHLSSKTLVEVMPFAEAVLPRTCYLVIDRTAELVTRPLKDFGELGQIPEAEIQSRTLPIFDNHRIARRFSHRNQRIIKVPDADMLKKTSTQLSAKGITRLLVNGHLYSL